MMTLCISYRRVYCIAADANGVPSHIYHNILVKCECSFFPPPSLSLSLSFLFLFLFPSLPQSPLPPHPLSSARVRCRRALTCAYTPHFRCDRACKQVGAPTMILDMVTPAGNGTCLKQKPKLEYITKRTRHVERINPYLGKTAGCS